MTNRKYLETNKIAFDKAMAEFNASDLKSFDEWLNEERIEWLFKVGDFLKHPHVTGVVVVKDFDKNYMYFKVLLRNGTFDKYDISTVENNKYHNDNSVFIARKNNSSGFEQHQFTKIF